MFNKALIIGILLVGATFSISANEVQKWEYECLYVYEGMAKQWSEDCMKKSICEYSNQHYGVEWKFNRMGEEGWELTTTVFETQYGKRMVCFKRPKKS